MLLSRTTIVAGLAVAGLTAAAPAFARPDTRAMTCEQVQRMVESHRAVVLTTGKNTYDRYVARYGNECDWPEVPLSSYVKTQDGQCRLYRCQEPSFDLED